MSAPITVDKGIPVPNGGSGRGIYPWAEMEVGDSFFVPDVKPSKLSNCSTSYRNNGHKDKRFRSRAVEGGARIWRIA